MALLRLKKVSIAFGTHALLKQAHFQLEEGERVGLLGRNGEGKSTLMKIVMRHIHADEGEVWYKPELRIAVLEQMPHLPDEETIYDVVAGGLGEVGEWIKRYHELTLLTEFTDAVMKEMGDLQHKLDVHNGWQIQQRVENILTRLNLPSESKVKGLSGGWKRRVSLAKALVIDPEVLLLDEPTNHLDLESILWLEEQLLNFKGAILFITHDRSFLQKLATRIIDLDRGQLVSWPGDYADYLVKKAASLEEEATQNSLFDKKLAEEEVWIRQGIKARRTRNEGRVRALQALRKERRAQRRNLQGTTKLTMASGEASGKKVIEMQNVSFAYPDKAIVKNFSTVIQRGDKIGLIGPNGAGKTSFLKLLLKDLQADSGTVEQGTKLQVAYFDQLREELNLEISVADSIAEGNDHVLINGEPRHVISYLSDFLFAPARARSPVKTLSGGEKNRLLLAKLFTKTANLIIMDEPTNDLDMETLELLEERLVEYTGTLLIVSHDRVFLDNVVTSVIVFEGEGVVSEFVGGYSDWLAYSQAQAKDQAKSLKKVSKAESKLSAETVTEKKKISYKEQKELTELPAIIEVLESKQAEVNEKIVASEFYQQDQKEVDLILKKLAKINTDLEQAYARWDELEALGE